ncbi:hypothetical protein X975_14115, partial [Stegodyphus mimosarum]
MDIEMFFTVVKDKPVCLICNEAVAVFKEYNIIIESEFPEFNISRPQ